MGHDVTLVVTGDLRRSRLTVFFRLLLAIPHFIWLALWGIAAWIAGVIAWFAALFTTRVPGGLHDFLARYVRYQVHVFAYLSLSRPIRFPSSTGPRAIRSTSGSRRRGSRVASLSSSACCSRSPRS